MPSSTIRNQVEKLALCAKDFDTQALSLRQTERGLAQKMALLRGNNWVGTAADQLYCEMDARVFPQLARLTQSLELGRDITRTIQQHWDKADGDAAALLTLDLNEGNVKDRTPGATHPPPTGGGAAPGLDGGGGSPAPSAGSGGGGGGGGGGGSPGPGTGPGDGGSPAPSPAPVAGPGDGEEEPDPGAGPIVGPPPATGDDEPPPESILPPYEKPIFDDGDPEFDPGADDPDLNFPPPQIDPETGNTPYPPYIPGVSDLIDGLIMNAAQLLNTLTPGAGEDLVASMQQGFGMPQASVDALNAFMPGLGDALQAVIAPTIQGDAQTPRPGDVEYTDPHHQPAVDEITHNLELIEPGLGAQWRDAWIAGAPLPQALIDKLNDYEPGLGDHFASWLGNAGPGAGEPSWPPHGDAGIEKMPKAIDTALVGDPGFDVDRGIEVFPIASAMNEGVNAAPVPVDALMRPGEDAGSGAGSGGGGSSPAALESAISAAASTVPADAPSETQSNSAPSAAPSAGGGGGSGSEAATSAPAASASGSYSPSTAAGNASGLVQVDDNGLGNSGPARETTANPNSGYLTPWLNEGNGAANPSANAGNRSDGLGVTSWAALAGAAATVLAAVIGKKANAPARVE